MHRPNASSSSIAGPERKDISCLGLPKTLDWDQEESRKLEALEADIHIEDVKFDEKDIVADGMERAKEKCSQAANVIPYWRSRKLLAWAVACTAGLALLNAVLAIRLRDKSSPFSIDEFAENHIPLYSLKAAERDRNSPQARALKLLNSTPHGSFPLYRLKQRYALAVLLYSTVSVVDESMKAGECTWFSNSEVPTILGDREVCDDDERYLSLVLAGNTFNGTIPSELEMLTSLRYLNLQQSSVRGTVPPHL
jgi:hypothetical protein